MSFPYINVMMIETLKLIYNVLNQGFDKKSVVIKRLKSYANTFFYGVGGKTFRKEVMLHTLQKAHILICWVMSGNDLSVIPWEVWPSKQEKVWDTDPKTGISKPVVILGSNIHSDDSYSPSYQRFMDQQRREWAKKDKKLRKKMLYPKLIPECLKDLEY